MFHYFLCHPMHAAFEQAEHRLHLRFQLASWVNAKKDHCSERRADVVFLSPLNFQPVHLIHLVSKNDTDLACFNSDVHQPILMIFDRSAAERVSCQIMIYFSTSTIVSALLVEIRPPEVPCFYLNVVYCIVIKRENMIKLSLGYS